MLMYRWWSEYLRNYAQGSIVVCAPDVEAARAKAREGFEAHVRERYDYLYYDGEPMDEDSVEQIDAYRATFEKDIAVEPEVMSGVLFLAGSE